MDIVVGIIDRLAPMRQVRVKQRTEPWMTGDILSGIRRRDALLASFKRDRANLDIYREYCRIRNRVQRDVRMAKQVYFRGLIQHSEGDSGKLWKNLKSVGFAAKARSGAKIVLDVGGSKCFDMRSVAAHFNSFFTEVAVKLVACLPLPRGVF